MGRILNLLVLVLLLSWVIGLFAFDANYLIHILLIIALISIILRVLFGRKKSR